MINIIGLFCLYFAKPNYSSAMDTSSTFPDCARAQQSISKTMVQNFGAILKKNQWSMHKQKLILQFNGANIQLSSDIKRIHLI